MGRYQPRDSQGQPIPQHEIDQAARWETSRLASIGEARNPDGLRAHLEREFREERGRKRLVEVLAAMREDRERKSRPRPSPLIPERRWIDGDELGIQEGQLYHKPRPRPPLAKVKAAAKDGLIDAQDWLAFYRAALRTRDWAPLDLWVEQARDRNSELYRDFCDRWGSVLAWEILRGVEAHLVAANPKAVSKLGEVGFLALGPIVEEIRSRWLLALVSYQEKADQVEERRAALANDAERYGLPALDSVLDFLAAAEEARSTPEPEIS